MAKILKYLSNSRGFVSLLKPPATVSIGRRTLYAANVLGLDTFVERRERASNQFNEIKDKFIGRMQEFVKTDAHGLVFTDDLKNVIFLANDNTEDIGLVVQMLKKFHNQNKELRFGNFIFGPVVMRLLHTLDQADVAFQLITDPALLGFFDQVGSFTIAMDLMFIKQRYQNVLDVYELVKTRQLNASRYPRDPTVLALGACYKLNTADSLQVALKILRGAKESEAMILRKGITFASALALKQKDPHLALEMLSVCKQTGYFTVRNLRALALAELNRVEDVIMDMKFILERDMPETKENHHIYCRETLDAVRAAADRLQNKEYSLKLQRLEQALEEHGLISSTSVDSSLCSPVTTKPDFRNNRKPPEIGGYESRFYANTGSNYRTANPYDQQREGGARNVASRQQRKGLREFDE